MNDEQRAQLRDLYDRWAAAEAVAQGLNHEIAVLEHNLGFTDYVGGPHLMSRRETYPFAPESLNSRHDSGSGDV